MPSLSYDSQSFIWNGNRLWMIGVNVEYALLAPERWRAALLSLKQMGFNTIRTSAPWCLHEPRAGRTDFTGALDVGAFVRLCGELGLHVVLRIGPVVGEPFDGGGLPAWLSDQPDMKLRVTNEAFMKNATKFFQAVAKEVAGLQATVEARRGEGFAGARANDGGPLCAVQIEHAWTCGNEPEGKKYHAELLRYARESGFTVPVLTNNGLWISVEGCVEVWEGWSDLFSNLRQLRTIQPAAPRFVEIREEAARAAGRNDNGTNTKITGNKSARDLNTQLVNSNANSGSNGWSDGMEYLRRMGQILCAGGQPTLPGVARTDRTNAVPAMLDSVGQPDNNTRQLRRMVSFSNNFGFVFAGADGSKQASVQDLDSLTPGSFAVVTVEGGGTIVFVFRGADQPGKPRLDATTIITPSGVRMPVNLGDAPVGWYLSNINLHGAGLMDFCNLSPFAFIQNKMLVLQGPAQTYGVLSIDGAVIEFMLPKVGDKPLVFTHQKFTVVACNQEQIDATLLGVDGVTIGADHIRIGQSAAHHSTDAGDKKVSQSSGLMNATNQSDAHNTLVQMSPGFTQAFHVSLAGAITELAASAPRKQVERALNNWQMAACQDYVLGNSDRFATLSEPHSLAKCGAAAGWGWYKLSWTPDSKSSAPQSLHFPQATGHMQAWLNGKDLGVLNEKSAALPLVIAPNKSSAAKNAPVLVGAASQFKGGNGKHNHKTSAPGKAPMHTLTLLARQGGTSANSAHQHRAVGVFGNALAVTPLKTKITTIDSPAVDPFKAAAFLPGVALGHHMSTHAAHISFTYSGKGAITIDAPATSLRAAVLLNGAVIDFIDWRGELGDALVLHAAPKGSKIGLKIGVNELVLVPVASDHELSADVQAAANTKSSKKKSDTSAATTTFVAAQASIENACKQFRFYQSSETALASNATWSFARWELPGKTLDAWQPLKAIKPGEPRWFTTTFAKPQVSSGPISITCEGLSHGHVLLNGKIVGNYNTQQDRARIELPTEAMPATNTLSIFDVQGRSPVGVKLSFAQ